MLGSRWASSWLLFAARHAYGQPTEGARSLERRAEGDLCYINNQKMAKIGDRLYFMGGDYHFDGDARGKTYPSDNLFYLDLSANSDIVAEGILSSSSLNRVSVPFDTTPTLQNQTHSQGGAFFYTFDSMYVFAGLESGSPSETNVLAMYNTTSGTWSSHTVSGGKYNKLNRLFPGAASVPSTGLSFFSGGGNAGVTKPGQPTGMLRFDASNPDALTWRNETATSSSGVPVPARVGGNMVYVPMGEQGSILLWGGYNGTEVNKTTKQPQFTYQLLDNQRIYVYDIASAVWNIVWAQGDEIPGRRSETCAVVSAAPDYSSFNIAMYGGWNLYNREAYSETWVLSVPSFRWIKMESSNYTGSNTEALSGDKRGRHQHRCAVHNDAQMIVLGGVVTDNGTETDQTCDSRQPPLRVLNLATMTWQKTFDPSAEYSVPPDVYAVIGGDGSGGASIKQPDGGFNDTSVARIFATTVARAAATASTTGSASSSNTASSPSDSDGSSSSSNTRAIVGGVVGGVVGGIACLALVAWLLLRRRKRQSQQQQQPRQQHTLVPQHDSDLPPSAELDAVGPWMGGELDGKSHVVGEMDARPTVVAEMEGDSPDDVHRRT